MISVVKKKHNEIKSLCIVSVHHVSDLVVPRGYMSFPHGEGERAETLLSYRDVTSPINHEDYHLDSSGDKGRFYPPLCSNERWSYDQAGKLEF